MAWAHGPHGSDAGKRLLHVLKQYLDGATTTAVVGLASPTSGLAVAVSPFVVRPSHDLMP